jgi:hypothetical protein
MISHSQFGRLRLADFRPEKGVAALENWEFMDQTWVGEAVGFSEWLRLEGDPEILRSLAVDFAEFPADAAHEVLRTVELPIRRGMQLHELEKLLGKPVKEHRFVDDRVSYDFVVAGPPHYDVFCTVLNAGGLTYLVIMAPRPRRTD